MHEPKRIVIVGGGISGLAVAWWTREYARAQGRAVEIRLLEASDRLGGTIFTDTRDGYRCEWGPNGFLDSKPSTLKLVEGLGMSDRLLPSSDEAARRFVLVDGALVELPTSPGAFMRSRLLSFGGKMRVLGEPWVRRGGDPEETVGSFARRRLGQQAYERLVDPFVSGIFAGDPDRLIVRAAFPRLTELEEEFGSLITASRKLKKARGKDANAAGPSGRLTSFAGGMSELVGGLATSLGPVISLVQPVTDLRRADGAWVVSTATEALRDVDHVILAVPAFVGARLLGPLDPALVEPLSDIPYAPAAVVGLGYAKEGLGHDLDGFGFLCPGREERRILGCLWSSSVFPGERAPEGHALLRCIVGGARRPDLAVMPDEELLPVVRGEIEDILGISAQPGYVNVIRHPSAIPQYEAGHMQRLEALDAALQAWPGLRLTGNAFRGVGINDCTREAERIARELMGDVAPT